MRCVNVGRKLMRYIVDVLYRAWRRSLRRKSDD